MARTPAARRFSEAVGQQIRALRAQAGITQEDVAASARNNGLNWVRATVAAVELGRRELSCSELLLLPVALYGVGLRVELADLIPEKGQIEMSKYSPKAGFPVSRTIEAGALRQIVSGRACDAMRHLATTTLDKIARHAPEALASLGDSVVKAAGRLGVQPSVLTRTAMKLWGQSLSEERERRLAREDISESDPRSLQARRGHITRKLLAEIQDEIA